MRPLLFTFTLLLAAASFAQQTQPPGYPQSSSPQQTMPEGSMPPDQRVPSDQTPQGQEPIAPDSMGPAQVEQEIQEALQAQPALADAKISVSANNTSVALSGAVANERQHQMALRVAALHAGGLRIIDRIKVQQ